MIYLLFIAGGHYCISVMGSTNFYFRFFYTAMPLLLEAIYFCKVFLVVAIYSPSVVLTRRKATSSVSTIQLASPVVYTNIVLEKLFRDTIEDIYEGFDAYMLRVIPYSYFIRFLDFQETIKHLSKIVMLFAHQWSSPLPRGFRQRERDAELKYCCSTPIISERSNYISSLYRSLRLWCCSMNIS